MFHPTRLRIRSALPHGIPSLQIFIIILVASLMLAAESVPVGENHPVPFSSFGFLPDSAGHSILWTILLFAAVAFFVAIPMFFLNRALSHRASWKRVFWVQRIPDLGLWILLTTHFIALFAFGFLSAIRYVVGNLILLDELAALMPTLICLMIVWDTQYPLSRAVRFSEARHALDPEAAASQIWTRGQFLLANIRLHLVLLLLPILILLTWSETLDYAAAQLDFLEFESEGWLYGTVLIGGTVLIFILLPLLICKLWGTRPIPGGVLRDRLEAMCLGHGVRIRDIHHWNTYNALLNGAVIGFLPRFRYVLLTDRLTDDLTMAQLEAVMAHELAHIRHRHLFWLAVVLGTIMWMGTLAVEVVVGWLTPASTSESVAWAWWLWPLIRPPQQGWSADTIAVAAFSASLVASLVLFGWISRRFERQADTFAVQHLSGRIERGPFAAAPPVSEAAVHTMIAALQRIIELNHVPAERRSWRHGSIAWRQKYLSTIVGQSTDRLAIDRTVALIKIAFAGALLGLSGWSWYASFAAG